MNGDNGRTRAFASAMVCFVVLLTGCAPKAELEAARGQIKGLQGQVTSTKAEIVQLQAENAVLKQSISSLQGESAHPKENISSLQR